MILLSSLFILPLLEIPRDFSAAFCFSSLSSPPLEMVHACPDALKEMTTKTQFAV